MLAHAASAQGISAVENMCGREHVLDHNTVPAACFTHPEVQNFLPIASLAICMVRIMDKQHNMLSPPGATACILTVYPHPWVMLFAVPGVYAHASVMLLAATRALSPDL
jgi:hypothetical protein